MPFKTWSSSALRHVILWSTKTIKIGLKFVFPVCRINLRIQHLTCSFINHRVTIHHNISVKSLPCEFPHRIFHQLLIICFLVNYLLLSEFIQTRHTGRGTWTKNNLCTLWWYLWWLLQALPLFSYSFDGVYSTFLQVLTAMSCSFIIRFVTSDQLQKSFVLLFTPQKIHHHHHSACCIVGFLHGCIYTLQDIPEDDYFYLVSIQNQSLTQLFHFMSYGTSWPLKFVFMCSIHFFNLP